MPRGQNFHRPYPPEFRREAVELVRRAGKPLSEIAGDLGVSAETLRTWTRQAAVDGGELGGVSSEEREELRRLRRENRVLREERDILRKATAFFARESETR
jgi:transposase